MNFVAIDFETVTGSKNSAFAVDIVTFEVGVIVVELEEIYLIFWGHDN